jgi:hypothetical protein
MEWNLNPRSEGEHVAMSWLCEMTALHQAAARFSSRVRWVNFDAFLSEPFAELQSIFRTLGATPANSEIEVLVTGSTMRQIFEGARTCLWRRAAKGGASVSRL